MTSYSYLFTRIVEKILIFPRFEQRKATFQNRVDVRLSLNKKEGIVTL